MEKLFYDPPGSPPATCPVKGRCCRYSQKLHGTRPRNQGRPSGSSAFAARVIRLLLWLGSHSYPQIMID